MMPTAGPATIRRRLVALVAVAILGVAWLISGDELNGEPERRGASVEEIEIESEAVGQKLPTSVVISDEIDPDGSPLLVFLHGRGGDHDSSITQAVYDALEDLGDRAPVIAFPDGDEDSFWHTRQSGAWDAYVVKEVIPAVAREFGVDRDRVAIGGISMGGFGALDIGRLNPGTFCAIGAHSPGLWLTGAETAAGAFDDAEDFARHDVVAAVASSQPYDDTPVWLDVGEDDLFIPGAAAFISGARTHGVSLTARIWPGGHDGAYWESHWDEYLRFYARSLADCPGR